MRIPAVLPLLSLIAAGPGDPRSRQALADEIERTLVLPKGAHPLHAYGRNYAFAGPQRIVATYLIPPPPAEIRSAGPRARRAARWTAAGKRRWYDDRRDLPSIYDGGCEQVNVEYRVATHRFVAVSCNGEG